MADGRRVSTAGIYSVISGTSRRVSTTGVYAVVIEPTRRVSTAGVYGIQRVCGEKPKVSIGAFISPDKASVAVDPLSEYLEVIFEVYRDGELFHQESKEGEDNFFISLSGLEDGETYRVRAKVRRECGWSFWSEFIEFVFRQLGGDIGCPPSPRGWLQNPDGNPPNLDGTGWYHPLPGEPLRGEEDEIILRDGRSDHIWDFYISDNLGVTYSILAEDIPSGLIDGDGLVTYRYTLDTTQFSDGVDYRLRAVSQADGTVYESLSFAIDNAEEVRWWTHRGREGLGDRFAKFWSQAKSGGVFGNPVGKEIWYRGQDGGIVALSGHNWAMFTDLDVPKCLGADVTLRFYIWSGEGGLFGLGGRDDTELFDVGPVFLADGESLEDQVGLMVNVNNWVTWPLDCCDDHLTSNTASVEIKARKSGAESFANIGSITQGSNILVEGGGVLGGIIPKLRKMRFMNIRPIRWISQELKNLFPLLGWRGGSVPGEEPTFDRTCARRYEMYSLRARVEVDSQDRKRVRVRTRLDGPGVDPPDIGSYWHTDHWTEAPEEWECGYVGFASRQYNNGAYYEGDDGHGARVFMTLSTLPFTEDCVEDICPPCPDNIPPLEICPLCAVDPPELTIEELGVDFARLRGTEISPSELTHISSVWRLYSQSDLESPLEETEHVCGEEKIRWTWEGLDCEIPYASTVQYLGWDEDEGVCCLSPESEPILFELECPTVGDPGGPGEPPPLPEDCPRCVPPETGYEDCEATITSYEGCSSPSTSYEEEC